MDLEKQIKVGGDEYTLRATDGKLEEGEFYITEVKLISTGKTDTEFNTFRFDSAVKWDNVGGWLIATEMAGSYIDSLKESVGDRLFSVLEDAGVESSKYDSARHINEGTKRSSVLKAVVASSPSTRVEIEERLGENRDENPSIQSELTVLKERGLISIIWWEDRFAVYIPTALGYKEVACMWGTPRKEEAIEKIEEEQLEGNGFKTLVESAKQ